MTIQTIDAIESTLSSRDLVIAMCIYELACVSTRDYIHTQAMFATR